MNQIHPRPEPTIIPRSEHGISRANISESSLKVLYRLHNAGFRAFLVGGPATAGATVLLAHGAGAAMDSPSMSAFAQAIEAAGLRVARFEFGYMAARRTSEGKKPPPRAETLMDEYREAVAEGIARKLSTIGLKATDGIVLPDNPTGPREGIVTGLIKRRNESIAALNDQVDAWDVRLETRRTSLQRQYSALEVALGKLKDQQNWLSGQLAGLS